MLLVQQLALPLPSPVCPASIASPALQHGACPACRTAPCHAMPCYAVSYLENLLCWPIVTSEVVPCLHSRPSAHTNLPFHSDPQCMHAPVPVRPPALQLVMQRLMSSVWLPPGAVLEWLEQHTQIRCAMCVRV